MSEYTESLRNIRYKPTINVFLFIDQCDRRQNKSSNFSSRRDLGQLTVLGGGFGLRTRGPRVNPGRVFLDRGAIDSILSLETAGLMVVRLLHDLRLRSRSERLPCTAETRRNE